MYKGCKGLDKLKCQTCGEEIGDTMQDLVNHKRVCKKAKMAELQPIEQAYIKSIRRKFKVLGAVSVLLGLGSMVASVALGSIGVFAFLGGLIFMGIGVYLYLDI